MTNLKIDFTKYYIIESKHMGAYYQRLLIKGEHLDNSKRRGILNHVEINYDVREATELEVILYAKD